MTHHQNPGKIHNIKAANKSFENMVKLRQIIWGL
jgi:hypothetical protein